MSPTLDCPSLESLSLTCSLFGVHFLENLNGTCPNLKKIETHRARAQGGRAEGPHGPLRFFHENLEELSFLSLRYTPMHVICPKLGKLVLSSVGSEEQEPILEMDCPRVTTFQIFGYHIGACLPSILLALPSLKFLYISNAQIEKREVVLEHYCVEDIVIAHSNMNKLRLVMPSLVRVSLVESCVRDLQVLPRVVVTIETSFYGEKVRTVILGEDMVTCCDLKTCSRSKSFEC